MTPSFNIISIIVFNKENKVSSVPNVLNFSIIGLEDYVISFERYCSPCDIQKYCKYGKDVPFSVNINCGDLNRAKEKIKFEQLQKLQKSEDVSVTYEELVKKYVR